MAKSSNQKLKLLYLVRYLMQFSDEEHPVSTAQIIEELARNGISAERKSIYDDIESLQNFSFNIIGIDFRFGAINQDIDIWLGLEPIVFSSYIG